MVDQAGGEGAELCSGSEGKPNKICSWIPGGGSGLTPRARAARWMADWEALFCLDLLRIAYWPSRLGEGGSAGGMLKSRAR